jgi:iron(III) transport system substrate-binding protein
MKSLLRLPVLPLLVLLCSCDSKSTGQVMLYTSVDEPVVRPIIEAFEKQTGLKVVIRTDTEATRTVGLSERLLAEKDRPQADVWWGNEPFHTVNLAESGVLAEFMPPIHAKIPAVFRDPKCRWAGTALRARVIAVSDQLTGKPITSLDDLADPALKGRIAMARPSAGTTGGHVAALYALWGDEKADTFFQKLADNQIKLVGGNSVVAEMVGQGTLLAGLTDNDDVDSAKAAGGKLHMVLPDQGSDRIGTLTIPCTVGLVKGGPNPENARRLVEYLLSPEVEKQLLDAKFARYSVFASEGDSAVKPMYVEFAAVAAQLNRAVQRALKILESR